MFTGLPSCHEYIVCSSTSIHLENSNKILYESNRCVMNYHETLEMTHQVSWSNISILQVVILEQPASTETNTLWNRLTHRYTEFNFTRQWMGSSRVFYCSVDGTLNINLCFAAAKNSYFTFHAYWEYFTSEYTIVSINPLIWLFYGRVMAGWRQIYNILVADCMEIDFSAQYSQRVSA